MSLYLLGSWGTEHWQKGTLWLSPRFSFFLCFLIAAGPCAKRVHWMALRNYLYCPHTRFVHLSDPSALKNCQLHKEEGINTFREIWDQRGRERGREREGRTNWETSSPVAHGPYGVRQTLQSWPVGERERGREGEEKWRPFRCHSTCPRVCSFSAPWLPLPRRLIPF